MKAGKKIDWQHQFDWRNFAHSIFAALFLFAIPASRCQTSESEVVKQKAAVNVPDNRQSTVDFRQLTTALSSRQIASAKYLPTPQSVLLPVYKSSGKEFHFIFLASVGSESSNDPSLRRIYISARSRVHGKISLANGAWEQSFVTNAKGLIAIDLPDWAEIMSFQTEVIIPKVFKIEAEDEIAVYSLSHKWLSTDGSLILPIEALGRSYTIASVRNALDYFGGRVNPQFASSINPRSEFGIAATEDNTTITVTLTADSYTRNIRRSIPFTFKMNKGEATQIMAHDTAQTGIFYGVLSWIGQLANGIDCDLTGSTITSDKPIAVFSGHERASVPDSLEYVYDNHPSVSRDHLMEQMPPQENWGQHFVVIASVQDDYGKRPKTGDIIRVIAASDSTVVLVNGIFQAKLIKGSYTQFPLKKLAYIETTHPALVVKYLRTALPDSAAPGDPDLTVVPPLENMSMFYSIPTVADGFNFLNHFITIIADSLALRSTTLNGFPLNSRIFAPVPGSRYYWTTQRTFAGSQRVESTLPCYAETYGYGPFDSYSFSGGGSFKYLHDLIAKDLDFGKISTGDAKDSLTGLQSVSVPMPLGDSITIYGYSWENGDSNSFALLDTIKKPFTIPPGYQMQVNFKFHPISDGDFKARLRVWSSNTDDVFITVTGSSGTPLISIDPTTINFGRVHVGNKKDSFFTIKSVGTDNLAIHDGPLTYNNYLLGSAFSADSYIKSRDIPPFTQFPTETVYFQPLVRGIFKDSIYVASNSQNRRDTQKVYLIGKGINFIINSNGYSFGKIRVGKSSNSVSIPVTNTGDDTTAIRSISFTSDGDPQDFILDPMTLPGYPSVDWTLDTFQSLKNSHSFSATFSPKIDTANNIIDTGYRFAVVRIVTADGNIYYDTLSGIGAEPWLVATIPVLDFGTITNPLLASPAFLTKADTLFNKGSMVGILNALRHSDPTFFSLKATSPTTISDGTTIQENAIIPFAVDFNVTQIGDFIDTIYAHNDSRHEPVVIVKAKVRAGIAQIPADSLGVISNCLPVDTTIVIYNPYRVSVKISAVHFVGDTDGFELADTDRTHPLNNNGDTVTLNFPVIIPANGNFTFHIRYRFPADSLNGTQTVKIILTRPTGSDDGSVNYDTVVVTLTRKTVLLNLSVVLPPYRPSAGDQPFRFPIHINGDRLGKPELDNDTLRLVFSNKLIKPVGIDRTGSLSQSTTANGVPQQPPPIWDEATSTYSIPCVGLHVSTDQSRNTLLFTLLCNAYLTKDTGIRITPFVAFIDGPCAYRVAKDSTWLSYANECGDQTIRGLLLASRVPIIIHAPVPDPVTLKSNGITCSYYAAKDLLLSWKVYDAGGVMEAAMAETPISGGEGSFTIPLKQINVSGAHALVVTVRDSDTGAQTTVSSKFTVVK